MTAAELKTMASAGDWNPYALAYALATGAADPEAAMKRDGGTFRFVIWNGERWAETRKRIRVPAAAQTLFPEDHLETLAAHLTERGF